MRRVVALLLTLALAAAGGVVVAWAVTRPGDSPTAPEEARAQVAPPTDPAVEFPPALGNLPGIPSDLLVDPASGELWFALFGIAAPETTRLYRYDPLAATVKAYDLPPDVGSPLYSGIALDDRGHVIVGYGQTVIDMDPLSESYKVTTLPDPPLYFYRNYEADKAWITDIIVTGSKVLVGRLNAASVTELDLATGAVTEAPIPPDFGPPVRLLLVPGGLHLSNGFGFGAPRQVANLDLATGGFQPVPVGASDLAAAPDGSVLIATLDVPGIERLRGQSTEALASALQPHMTGIGDVVAVDSARNALWVAGWETGTVARLELATGQTKVYQLPVQVIYGEGVRCPAPVPCPTDVGTTITSVGGLTVDAKGNLYFSDKTKNRIGFIRAAS